MFAGQLDEVLKDTMGLKLWLRKQPRLQGCPHPLVYHRLGSLSDRQPSPRGRARLRRRLRRNNLLLRSSRGTPSLLSSPQVLVESPPRETSLPRPFLGRSRGRGGGGGGSRPGPVGGQRNECADHELGSDLQICISPDRSGPPGTEEITQTPDSNYLPDSPILAQPDMVQAANQPPSRCSQEAPRPVEPPQELGDSRALPRAGQTKLTARKLSADQSLRKCMVPRHMLCTDYKYSNIRTVM